MTKYPILFDEIKYGIENYMPQFVDNYDNFEEFINDSNDAFVQIMFEFFVDGMDAQFGELADVDRDVPFSFESYMNSHEVMDLMEKTFNKWKY